MSVFKPKNSIASVEFKKFKGIDTTAPHRETSAAQDMVNFRVLPDGSLQKRCGFKSLATFSEKIRGVWSGTINGKNLIFAVYGKIVSKIDPKTSRTSTIGKINTTEGTANFMFFNGYLYLSDEKYFYLITESSATLAEGYVPLYGKDWPVRYKGAVNEPLNIASRHIRMTYIVDQQLSFLCVDHLISSIDSVYVNDVLITDQSRYFFDEGIMCVCLSGLNVGDRVALFLTVDETEINKSAPWTCKRSAVYGDYKDNVLFLWDGEQKNVMFASCTVNEEAFEESKAMYPDSLPFYVPAVPAFTMPKKDHKITAVCRQYDHLLIFTQEDTWRGSLSSSAQRDLEVVTVNPSHGCTSPGASVMCENDPVFVSDGQILRATSNTDELNECNVYSISSKIEPLLPASFFSNAVMLIDKGRAEILFSDPTDTDGILWIYNYKTENWYKFDGIGAENMFLFEGALGFSYLNAVFLFYESLGNDKLRNGEHREIVAYYESYPTDLSVHGNKKRLCGMTLNANMSGQPIRAEYFSDGEVISSIDVESESVFPTSIIKRLNSRRFCYTNLRLVSNAEAPQRIYSTGIYAKA